MKKRSFVARFPNKTHMKKRSIFDKNHGLTPLQIFHFLIFFQTLLFRSKKHYFPSRISKNDLLWLDFPKKHIWEKWRFFDKNHGVNHLQMFDFLDFFQTLIFWSKMHSFLSRISKNDLLWLDFPKQRIWGNGRFLTKGMD